METFIIVVKGDVWEAGHEASIRRGLSPYTVKQNPGDTVFEVQAEEQALINWFCETSGQGRQPVGSLLFFNRKGK